MATDLLRIALLILSFALGAPALAQTTVTLQQGLNGYAGTTDTRLGNQGAQEGAAQDAALIAETSTSLLIRFAIFASEGGPVPDGATISSATLSLYKVWGPLTGDSTFRARRMLRSWNEMQATWSVAATGTPWQSIGAFGAQDVAATADGQGTVATQTDIWLNIDVTPGVQAFVSGTPNFGWKVAYVGGGDTSKPKSFNSAQNTAATTRPRLTITYASAPPPPPPPSGCNSGSSRPYTGAPVNGVAIPIGASGTTTFEAEHFNCGAEGSAYHDLVAGVNSGQTFRADNEVEIIDILNLGGGLAVNHFDTGEWIEHTISIGTAGNYTLGISASNSPSSGGSGIYRILVDGIPVGSDVTVTQGADWEDYRWFDTTAAVPLSVGTHVVRLLSVQQSFRIDKIRLTAGSTPPPPPPPPPPPSGDDCTRAGLTMCIRFEAAPDTQFAGTNVTSQNMGSSLRWFVENKNNDSATDTNRIALVSGGRDGSSAIRLQTLSDDTGVHGSSSSERSEIALANTDTGATAGADTWWAHSFFVPVDSNLPTATGAQAGIFQFHGTPSAGDQPNFILQIRNQENGRTVLRAYSAGVGGVPGRTDGTQYTYNVTGGPSNIVGQCIYDGFQKGHWYDLVHHIRWSYTGGASHEIWIRQDNGPVTKVLQKTGINNLYSGDSAYLKMGLYHEPVLGLNTAVIHDRLRRGTSADAVRMPDFTVDPNASVVVCPGTTTN